MKKFIAALVLTLAFTIAASAQEAKKDVLIVAKEQATELANYVGLTGDIVNDLAQLFVMKYENLAVEGLSQERKDYLSQIISAKLQASMTDEQWDKLSKNQELLKKLTR